MKHTAENTERAEVAGGADASLLFGFIPMVPLAFLGLGVYRAWIEIAFAGSFVNFPVFSFPVRDAFDLTMVVTTLAFVVFFRKLGPLHQRKGLLALAGITLVIATILIFSTCLVPQMATTLGLLASLFGGFGIAIIILLWSELFGCLNPLRVASYYSAGIVAGAVIIYIYRGFMFPWLFVMTALLPAISIACASRAFHDLAPEDRPKATKMTLSIPWKAMLLMAVYALAYGLLEEASYADGFGPHSEPGVVVAGIAVFLGVAIRDKRFDFGMVYRVALPLVVSAFLLLPALEFLPQSAAAFCVSAGYTMQSIIIMLILANLCYRYGASAILLFGLERGVRQIFMVAGRWISEAAHEFNILGNNGEIFISILAVLAVVAATAILFSEPELSSRWGSDIVASKTPEEARADVRKHELSVRVAQVAHDHKLSTREEEVLLLLAQRKTVGVIERELFIANGTAKAHVRHIYQKLDIHTRQELFDILDVDRVQTDQPDR